jgi:hypothetical protein
MATAQQLVEAPLSGPGLKAEGRAGAGVGCSLGSRPQRGPLGGPVPGSRLPVGQSSDGITSTVRSDGPETLESSTSVLNYNAPEVDCPARPWEINVHARLSLLDRRLRHPPGYPQPT